MFDRLQSPTPQCAPPQTRQHWTNTTDTTTQTHTHTHTNPACTRCPQCPSLKTIIRMSVCVLRECPQNKSTNCKQVTTHEHMTVEQLPYPCKKCAPFLYARRTCVHVGDFHVDSENGIPSSYVSALMPCARNVTIRRNTCCPFRDGALLDHVPRSEKRLHLPAILAW